MPNLVQATATLIRCIAFYFAVCGLRVLVVDILKVDLGPAARAFMDFKTPTFQAQGGNWSSEESGQEKREV
jgi:hypothetical protein